MRPQFSAARSPALIASIVAVALLLSQAAPGLATNFGAGGGVMFANGAAHSFIYVGLTTIIRSLPIRPERMISTRLISTRR